VDFRLDNFFFSLPLASLEIHTTAVKRTEREVNLSSQSNSDIYRICGILHLHTHVLGLRIYTYIYTSGIVISFLGTERDSRTNKWTVDYLYICIHAFNQ
jgi:hypothetical protein